MIAETNMTQASADYALVAAAIEYLETHHTAQPDLDQLAATLALSPSHLQRVFRRWAGISPKRFLQFLTVEHAKELLAAGADCLTLGDHAFDQKDMLSFIEQEPRIVRPLNFSKVAPGRGFRVFEATQGRKVLVTQALGQVLSLIHI